MKKGYDEKEIFYCQYREVDSILFKRQLLNVIIVVNIAVICVTLEI